MSLRYGKGFQWLRKFARKSLSALYPFVIRVFPLPQVFSIDETLDTLLRNKLSISRFGDGEFLYIIDHVNLPFQQQDARLRSKLIEVLQSNDASILIGFPIGYHSIENLTPESTETWKSQIVWIYPRLRKYLRSGKIYYNSSMTRPYADYQDKSKSKNYFEKLKLLWSGRNVLLVEGEKSRLGVDNDLFSTAQSIERILAPQHNAFAKYDDIVSFVQTQDREKLVLLALGPTATVMAFDLYHLGFQAIDIGNVDIEYEWYLRNARSKIKIIGKYTSEAIGGRVVEDVLDPLYQKQIIKTFLLNE